MDLKKLQKKHVKKTSFFDKVTKLNPKKLDLEIAMNSSRMNTVGSKKADAEYIRDKAKSNLKKIKAKAVSKWSKKTVDGKKLTIPQVNAKVDYDPEVVKAEETLNQAQYVLSLCETAFVSMKEKGQQLSNLAYGKRAELKHNYVKEATETRVDKKFKKKK